MTFESHLEELPEDAPWHEKPGESDIEQHDTDQIPEVDVTEDDLLASGSTTENWLMYGNNYENQRHYVGEEITPDNVGQLEVEYQFEHLTPQNDFQGSPIIIQGDPPVMYITFGPDHVHALNARTGEFLWSHVYEPYVGTSEESPSAERGVSVLGDRIYTSTLDLGVQALDRYTGEEEWYFNGAAAYRGEPAENVMHEELQWERAVGTTSSFPPIIYNGRLSKGSFGGEYGVSGFYDAIDLEGNIEWRVNMTPEHEWVGDSWRHGGATAWPAGALDPRTEQIVIPSANPGPWYGTVRPGFNPYSAGKVGVDANTGEYAWHFQDAPHDWWDYDSSNPPMVIQGEIDGEQTSMAVWAGKTGWIYTVNMETGQLYQRSEEHVQHLNMWALPPQDDLESAPWVMPELQGGTNPQASAYDPHTQTYVVKGTNQPMKFSWYEVEYEAGENYIGMDTIRAEPVADEPEEEEEEEEELGADEDENDDDEPGDEEEEEVEDDEDDDEDEEEDPALMDDPRPDEWNGYHSVIVGLDPLTGRIKWRDWLDIETSTAGGCVSTPTGLTFAGTPEGEFVAYATETGERVWVDDIGVGVDGDPIIWHDPYEEKTYVAITAGGRRGGALDENLAGNVVTVYSLST
ncbi:PQQ-binding-like beta-propeller repeat protein [Natrononativus amylolyticus]|uniref:outer membrane protein assembly factor BamB family protein n=1 Tax=Natrononativus amylolyticus TaxID=2963434 RepID=UPI0020CBAC4C|nr:PQQ-binding-like beta-propeller repeat protein [Natrononativus amylolyticus]